MEAKAASLHECFARGVGQMDSGTANEIEGEVDKLATEARATLATAQTQRLKARAVEERVASVVTTQLRDLNSRVSAAVSKELERFVDAVALDLGQQTHTQQDRDALDALVRASLADQVATAVSFGLELELALGRFQESVAHYAAAIYADTITAAELHVASSIEARIDALTERIAWYLPSATSPMKEEKGDEVVAVSQSPRSTSIPAPDAATVLAPVPAPSSAPEVARRPSAALPARPVSVGVPVPVHPPPRPVVPSKPRPVTVAGEMTSPTSSTEQYHPTPTDASAVSQSYEGQTTAEGVEPPSVKPPQVQARNKALMGDLNRMLAGGPPKKSFGVSVEHAAEEGAESPIAGGGVPLSPLHSASLSAGETKAVEETWTDDSLATQKVDDSNPPLSPVSPGGSPPLVSPSPAAVKMKASAVSLTESRKSLTVNQAPPPVTPSPAAAAASGTAPALDPAASVAPSNSAGGEKKKGFMGMLSHLTKTRPKAGRVTAKKEDAAGGAAVAGTSDQAMNEHHDVEATTSGDVLAARSTDKVGSELELEEENDYNLAHSVVVQEPTPTGPTPAADEAIEQEESHEEEPAAPVSPSVETDTLPPRPPVPRPRPVPAPPSNAARVSISSDPRRASGIDLGNAESNVNLNPVPPPRPRPTPRPESVDRPVSAVSQAASLNEEAAAAVAEEYMRTSVAEEISAGTTGEERVSEEGAAQSENAAPARPLVPPKPPPKKIPGIFANQRGHNAMAALASAMNSRLSGSQSLEEGLDQAASVTTPAAGAVADGEAAGALDSPASAVPVHLSSDALQAPRRVSEQDPYPQVKLNIKRAEHSNSGDDKAIEKQAIDWMNQHLAAQNVQIDDLYGSLGNGLNLIYALEDATGESVGKYNKRAMLPVHKIDNIAVALNFLSKKGIATGFISPQDVMDGNKSKILTLFNYITKKF